MPAVGFDCTCGWVPFAQCLDDCPAGTRCLSLPTLKAMAGVRDWAGVPSTTQLLNGTREAMLSVTKPFYIDPQQQAFSLLGTQHHAIMESQLTPDEFGETRLYLDGCSGMPDYYANGELWDYKTLGSYKAAQILGMDYTEEETDEVYVIGAKKGQPKLKKVWFRNPDKVENYEYTMQLNHYRVMLEAEGKPVDRMMLQITVRDGGTQTATSRGVTDNIVVVEVERLDDNMVRGFFQDKKDKLLSAIVAQNCTKCSTTETWDGLKCEKYCNVSSYCKEML